MPSPHALSYFADELPLVCPDSDSQHDSRDFHGIARRSREARRVAAWLLGIAVVTACVCWAVAGHSGNQRVVQADHRDAAMVEQSTLLAEAEKKKSSSASPTPKPTPKPAPAPTPKPAPAPAPKLEDAQPKDTGKEGATDEDDMFGDSWPCEKDEKLFFGRCFVMCDVATDGVYPYRDHECTCCKDQPCNLHNLTDYKTDCNLLYKGANGTEVHNPYLFTCPYQDEELFDGLCFKKCSLMTHGRYPIRAAMNTCSNGEYGGNWTMGLGPCSGFGIGGTLCLPHIPLAAGMGHSAGGSKENYGVAPMGFPLDDLPVTGDGARNEPKYSLKVPEAPTPPQPPAPPAHS